MSIKNIVFDMGNVLIEDNMPGFAAQYLPSKSDQKIILKELFYGPEWMEWNLGTMDIPAAAAGVEKRLPIRLRSVCARLMEDWGMNNPRIDGIEPLIRRLKENGYGIYLLSNTADTYYQYRHRLPAIEIFDGEFISADYHLLKPERSIYHKFTETFGLVPEENFFIDDRTENIEGAKDAGWSGFVFQKNIPELKNALAKAGVNTD